MTVDVNRRISAARLSPVKRQKNNPEPFPRPRIFYLPGNSSLIKSVTLIKQAQ